MGRRTQYRKEFCEKVKELAMQGLIDTQIAKGLGISHETYYRYQDKYPEFREAVKKGKFMVDDLVESALLKRATGFEYKEVRTIMVPKEKSEEVDIKDKKGMIKKIETTTKIVPADVSAIALWLKNRRPDIWRDKIEEDNIKGVRINVEVVYPQGEIIEGEVIKAIEEK